jgi:serine/threonine protein kinase
MESAEFHQPDPALMASLFDEALSATIPRAARESPPNTILKRLSLFSVVRSHGYNPILWLGRGGSASVWRCVDISFGREFAIKHMRADVGFSGEDCEELLRCEAEILGQLNHPGIVDAVRLIGKGADAALVMEFVDGDDLLEHCAVCKLGPKERLRLFARLLDAVAYLHEKGLVHGDLKPEHVIVRGDCPVLIDFGLAANHKCESQIAGKPPRIGGSGPYRAPEVRSGSSDAPDPRQDVFALGMVLQHMLAGISSDDRPEKVTVYIEKATADSRDDRWTDAREMRTAIGEIIADRSDPDTPKHRRFPLIGLLFTSLLLLTIGAGATWLITGRSDPSSSNWVKDESRVPLTLSPRANGLELTAHQAYRGNTAGAQQKIHHLLEQHPESRTTWELRHIQALIAGNGAANPFGEKPYQADVSAAVAYAPASRSIAYVYRQVNRSTICIRSQGAPPKLIGDTPYLVKSLALGPDANQVAALTQDGQVLIWSHVQEPSAVPTIRTLPRPHNDAIGIWYSRDGLSLMVLSLGSRRLERWRTDSADFGSLASVIEDCDQACPLPSVEGGFLICTAGDRRDNGKTLTRVIRDDGELIRSIELEDSQLPVSADTLASADAPVCLGMPRGYVRIFDPVAGRWLPDCDLGLNVSVSAIVYAPSARRIFAAMGRVHVIDLESKLVMRLGERDSPTLHNHIVAYEASNAALTAFSLSSIKQWIAPVE